LVLGHVFNLDSSLRAELSYLLQLLLPLLLLLLLLCLFALQLLLALLPGKGLVKRFLHNTRHMTTLPSEPAVDLSEAVLAL
jgi:hypothetical protein